MVRLSELLSLLLLTSHARARNDGGVSFFVRELLTVADALEGLPTFADGDVIIRQGQRGKHIP
jgi:hypothetical protein